MSSELNNATVKNLAKSIYPSANPFTKISLTHGGVEIPQTPLVAPADTFDNLMRAYGLRDDNDNGSLDKYYQLHSRQLWQYPSYSPDISTD